MPMIGALIVSSDRFEDSELCEPLQQLQEKEAEVDIAAPQRGPITSKHGHRAAAQRAHGDRSIFHSRRRRSRGSL